MHRVRQLIVALVLTGCSSPPTAPVDTDPPTPTGDTDPPAPTPAPLFEVVVTASLDGEAVGTEIPVNLDGVQVGVTGEVLEVEVGNYALTVGDLSDLTSDERPRYRVHDRTYVSRPTVLSVTGNTGRVQPEVILDVHVDTTLSCRYSSGVIRDVECLLDGEPGGLVWSSVVDVEVEFQVVGRDLEISHPTTWLTFTVDGSEVQANEGYLRVTALTNDGIELRWTDTGDCPQVTQWECPPPE